MEKFEKREIEDEDDDEKKEQESAEAISGLKKENKEIPKKISLFLIRKLLLLIPLPVLE